ncbi:hypothetical protein H2199_003182 [Coniosporium tulheliwenetii]|uniref:Uncharacterized protein n=1 Tax=Coniosporium tulheliwenetii TaxID=3383036 RepID=A0ACC2ZBN1_9PEZI|nr:hypothetical protein H2199_003182 [Cladosporium sp. JES 115]
MEASTPAAPSRSDAPDSRASLQHILAADPTVAFQAQEPATPAKPAQDAVKQEDHDDSMNEGRASKAGSASKEKEIPMYTSTTTTTRRNANGSVSSVYSGNKIRHLKKDDGIPLWRKDIQYDFLRFVFEDDKKVFHRFSDGTFGYTFADIYLDAMAKSSKCSKILKDKLLTERAAAINMAMVCLLVNVGRMNTTLNFFPEMRAQLRTYHSIPSLQAHQDPNAYKQLQDAPRLKSILKGATEDVEQPSTIEEVKAAKVPRTNPVNLIFVLAQYAPKISESDFSVEAAQENPFGPGQYGQPGDATNGMPLKCPPFKHLSEAEIAVENVDTEEEKIFGEMKRNERVSFTNNPVFSVASDDGANTPAQEHLSPAPQGSIGRGSRKPFLSTKPSNPDYPSDTSLNTRSASPPAPASTAPKSTPNMRINQLLNEETPPPAPPTAPERKGPGRGNWGPRRGINSNHPGAASGSRPAKTKGDATAVSEAQSLSLGAAGGAAAAAGPTGPHGFYLPLNGADPSHKRSRPLTAHQQAVEKYRKERVDFILDRRLREEFRAKKRKRVREGAVSRAWKRCKVLPDGYDTEEENPLGLAPEGVGSAPQQILAFGGLVPASLEWDDWGEEAHARLQVMRRAARRLDRWEGGTGESRKRRQVLGRELRYQDAEEQEEEERREREKEELEGEGDMDRERESSLPAGDGEDEQGEEELDEMDRELLGEVDADETDDED